ncbi:hypothetical protein B0O79_3512 [Flavobacteriaceae bacterium MAR_2009_75]|nr:hypothetical protein B0O79_3512 [Flavobacteriaceae bacterium MAR_2009_75]
MIKFFRKIRQKLLSENKFSKYLFYAIGEIVLVVIGILIALSINNWNEGRKDRAESIKILKKLQAEFEINTTELDASIHYHEQQAQAAVKVEALFDPNHKGPTDTIANLIIHLFDDWKFEPRQSITASALATSKIALINNDSLTDNLNNWMYALKKYNELHSSLGKLKDEMWVDVNENFPLRNLDSTRSISNFEGDPAVIFSSLKNENIVRSILLQQQFILDWCNALQEDHNDILRFINLELSENE